MEQLLNLPQPRFNSPAPQEQEQADFKTLPPFLPPEEPSPQEGAQPPVDLVAEASKFNALPQELQSVGGSGEVPEVLTQAKAYKPEPEPQPTIPAPYKSLNDAQEGLKQQFTVKEVDGKKFVSKKFLEENKDTLDHFSKALGFNDSKEFLQTVLQAKESVGTTKFNKNEYAGKKLTELPMGKVEKDTLILPDEWKQEDLKKAEEVASKHGLKPHEFFAFLRHETGDTLSPAVTNEIGATGFIQFTRTSAHDFNQLKKRSSEKANIEKLTPKASKEIDEKYPFVADLPKAERQDALKEAQYLTANMSIEEQLDLVDFYFDTTLRGKKGIESAYSAVFAGNPNKQTMPMSKGNESLDTNDNGVIERKEWTNKMLEKANFRRVKTGDS